MRRLRRYAVSFFRTTLAPFLLLMLTLVLSPVLIIVLLACVACPALEEDLDGWRDARGWGRLRQPERDIEGMSL